MTGYQSKKATAMDKLDDDDIQVYKKPWVDLTKEEKQECVNQSIYHTAWSSDVDLDTLINLIQQKLKDKNENRQEQNFCPRCGKRTNDIHTCTPPQENT